MRKWLFKFVWAVLRTSGIVFAYVMIGRLGRHLDSLSEQMRVFFPQSGIALAALMLFGLRYWPAVAIGSCLNLILAQGISGIRDVLACARSGAFPQCLFTDDPVAYALAPYLVTGNTLSSLFGAYVLGRIASFDRSFSRIEDGYRYVLYAVLLAPMISALVATYRFTELEPSARPAWSNLFLKRWLGQALSNLIVTPIFLVWSKRPRRSWRLVQIVELLVLIASLTVMGMFIFTSSFAIGLWNYPVSYAPFPLILWAALRFGARGAATATLIIAIFAIIGISQHAGPFARHNDLPTVNIGLLQVYLMVIAITGLLVGAVSTERQLSMEALQQSHEELQRLARQIEAAREQERAHLARELHDDLSQLLAAIRMCVWQLGKTLGNAPGVQERIQQLTELVNAAATSMRHLAASLRPGVLDDLGLVEAIRWQCEEFQKRFGIAVYFEPPSHLPEVASETSTALFRIVQESLTNVAKHAQAKNVLVRMECHSGWLSLEVRDDGIGIVPETLGRTKGLGVVGMRERMATVGGQFAIERNEALGHGTVVRVAVLVDRGHITQDTI
ncbi:MAG: MASE1 domain-containing protein [Candidatus Sumerlaeaceae bacterium]